MNNKMRAFHDSQELKDFYLDRVRAHAAADRLIQGTGWEHGKGCAVGCTLEAYDHGRYPIEVGIPRVLAHLEDRIFEGLPRAEAMTWPLRFLSAIAAGADLALVWPRFAVWLLEEELAKWRTPQSDAVAALYRRRIAGDEPSDAEWISARRSVADAYAYASADASAAAAAAAAYAAASYASASYASADAYASAAAYAAASYASADAYASAYARAKSFIRQSEKLLAILQEAK
jgi:hypothetical protein